MRKYIADLAKLPAPPGSEDSVREYCLSQGREGSTDGCGSGTIHRIGDGKRIAVVCGMDERGIFLSRKRGEGQFDFCSLGRCESSHLLGRTVILEHGGRGMIEQDRDGKQFFTLIVGGANEGEWGVISVPYREKDSRLTGGSVVRSTCCGAVLSLLEHGLGDCDAWYVFSALYQMGKKGAVTAVDRIRPELAFVIEPACVTKQEGRTPIALGKGGVVKLRDGGFMDYFHLADVLEQCPVPYQLSVSQTAELAGRPFISFGVPCITLGIPYEEDRYFTQTVEEKDVRSVVELILYLKEKIG